MLKNVICARACVVHDDKLLLVSNDESYWYLPGGHLEPKETLPDCAKREVYEETGYNIEIEDVIYCFEFLDRTIDKHKIEVCFKAKLIKESENQNWRDLGHDKSVTASRFLSLEEIKSYNVQPKFLKDGKWLDSFANNIYKGYEEAER